MRFTNIAFHHHIMSLVEQGEPDTGTQPNAPTPAEPTQDNTAQNSGGVGENHRDDDTHTNPMQNTDEPLKEAGLKALKEERETNKALKAELAHLKEQLTAKTAQTEQQDKDLETRLKALEQENAQTRRENMQIKAATNTGLPVEIAARLQGDTLEDMEKDAQQLLTLMHATPKGHSMQPDPSQGRSGEPRATNLAEAIKAHYSD